MFDRLLSIEPSGRLQTALGTGFATPGHSRRMVEFGLTVKSVGGWIRKLKMQRVSIDLK